MANILFEKWNAIPSETRIASNSLAIAQHDFVAETSGFMVKAGASSEILGISETIETFDSDNQTVDKAVVNFIPKQADLIMKLTIDDTATQADVGSYFNINNTTQTVDYATKATTASVVNTSDAGAATDPVITKQLKMVKFLTGTTWLFKLI